MQEKINEQFISDYILTFSSKVASSFFKEKTVITGKEILSLTPSKQVNFFVLKALYGRWQEEMKKLESPYFNYREPEVKKALVNYMNVLSQHIEVEEKEMTKLVELAVSEALHWLISPVEVLRQELEAKKVTSTDQESIKTMIRYFKIYSNEIKKALETVINKETEAFLSAFESQVNAIEDPEGLIKRELDLLSEIEPVRRSDIVYSEEGKEFVREEPDEESYEQEEDLAEDALLGGAEESEAKTEMDQDTQVIEEEPSAVSKEESPDEEDTVKSEDDLLEEEEHEESDYVGGSLNEQFKKKDETLNDQFKQEEVTVATTHQQRRVESILEAISVNNQYMFTSKLFGGDSDVFIESVGKIEKSKSFDDAVEMLVQDYAPTYSWDMNSNEVKELLKVVFRKFR